METNFPKEQDSSSANVDESKNPLNPEKLTINRSEESLQDNSKDFRLNEKIFMYIRDTAIILEPLSNSSDGKLQ
jgi:hypothetical protein